uniref:Uncharacterized protein n=1 Tax=Pipistrellus kuhlii TaxID=59472 RepID=A0A7J7UTK7_PIPKU|nr:hypothetical protein mPipKuh1_008714 [Pipistrellus kuhlii]
MSCQIFSLYPFNSSSLTKKNSSSCKIKNQYCRNWFGSVDRASPYELKGPGFDYGQGHVPWLRAHPQYGVCKRQLIDDSLSSMFLTLYPSLFLSVKKSINYIFLKKENQYNLTSFNSPLYNLT